MGWRTTPASPCYKQGRFQGWQTLVLRRKRVFLPKERGKHGPRLALGTDGFADHRVTTIARRAITAAKLSNHYISIVKQKTV